MNFLFSDKRGHIAPSSFAAGPFGNLHGGATAALMASTVLRELPEGFIPVSQHSEFLHSTSLTDLVIDIELKRDGRRHRVYDVELRNVGSRKVSARSSITCYNPIPTDLITPEAKTLWAGRKDPNQLPTAPDRSSPSGANEWMLCATDVRTDFEGTYWFRWRGALFEDGWDHWFTRLVGSADWVGGFVAPGFPSPKTGVWPNTDLTVKIDRPLVGDWIGLRPVGNYRETGFGLGRSELLDQGGVLGFVFASTISPLRPTK